MSAIALPGSNALASLLPRSRPRQVAPREGLLETLLANLDGMVFRCRNDEHWTMEFVSEGCSALTGYSSRDLLHNRGVSFEQLIHPDDRTLVRDTVESALAERRRYEVEYRLLRADGVTRWVWERGAGSFDDGGELRAIEGIIQDISSRKHAETLLFEAEQRYRGIFENALEGMFQTTGGGRYLSVNPALARIYGYDSAAQLMIELSDIERSLYVQSGRRREFARVMEEQGTVTNFESEVYRRDGSVIWISENARAVRNANGELMFYEGTVEAITERKRYEAEIRYQATHDALTGLPNRVLLYDALRGALRAAARRSDGRVSVGFIDLDHFKFINDTLGHSAGDELLLRVSQRLKACMRADDMVARQGGDEFVLLINNASDAELRRIGERVLSSLAQPVTIGGRELNISCSLGFATAPGDGEDIDGLLKSADVAMYRAKELGRNNCQFFSADMDHHEGDRLELVSRLHHALARGEFLLHYEPQFDVATRRIVGVEALVRWNTADGLVMPGRFIALAEETGLILSIGKWVLKTACEQTRRWRDAGLPAVPVSVNLSRRQLIQGDIVDDVAEVLRLTGLEAADLQLEITESMVMKDSDKALAVVARLRAMGVRIALDDFGSGYSSLSEIKRLPVTSLKIDRCFIRDANTDRGAAAIAQTIVALGRSLGLNVVAEGVETEAQHTLLTALGCPQAQGYHLGRPQDAAAFGLLLGRQAA